MGRIVVVGLALVLAAGGLTACGAEADGDAATRVYFIDGYRSELGTRGHLVARERSLGYRGLGRVVAELLRGPTATEIEERGLFTGFAPDVRVSTVALVDGTARIRLASKTPPRRWPDAFYAAAQLVYTLTELPGVSRVAVRVNGVRCCVYDMQQRPWIKPLTREIFANWQGAPVA